MTIIGNRIVAVGYSGETIWEKLVDRTIEKVDDSAIQIVRDRAFCGCTLLSEVNLPAAKMIGHYAFTECTNLTKVELPSTYYIWDYAFQSCANLSVLYLLGSSMCNLAEYVFKNTPFASGVGSIYVPASLYSSYMSRWSSLASLLVSVD